MEDSYFRGLKSNPGRLNGSFKMWGSVLRSVAGSEYPSHEFEICDTVRIGVGTKASYLSFE
jgi:hypothetical protein